MFLVLIGLATSQGWHAGALTTEFVREIGFGVLAGAIFGGGGGLLVREAQRRGYMLGSWVRHSALTIALACQRVRALVRIPRQGGQADVGASHRHAAASPRFRAAW